jgi:spoIIIJ-associated protein
VVDDAEQTTEDVLDADTATAGPGDSSDNGNPGEPDVAATEGGDEATDGTSSASSAASALSALEQEGEVAADYLEALLDILDLDGDLEIDIEGDRASVAIVGADLDNLVGQRGVTLEALQELTRLAVLQETGQRSRLMLDVGGYRQRRRTELVALATAAGERVAGNGQEEKLAPMTPFERKVVHDTIAAIDGVASDSEGEEPQRRVVVRPA